MVGMRLLRNILAFLIAFLLILFSFIPVLIVSGLFKYKKFLFSQSRLVIKTILALLGVQARVRGLAGVDFSVPQVFICNHLSNLDGPLLVSVLPVNPRVLIKAEARIIPLVGWVMKLADFVFVDRSSAQRRQEALGAAIEKVKKNCYSFLVFPEGTRSKDGRMRDFKKGSFLIALRAGVPVLPVKISGTRQLMPPGRRTVGAGTVEIEFFPRQELKNIAESELAEFIKKLQQKFYADKNHENH
ncbi:MAG: lysophospholipid acyltransferase family protein [Chrysiogenia bacterium]